MRKLHVFILQQVQRLQ